jgi:hypothetical protein
MSGSFITEESDNVTLVVIPKSRFCALCETYTCYGISMDNKPYEPRCRKHLPDGIIQEFWTRRMLNAALAGDEERARKLLRHVTTEARLNGYTRCACIADVKAEEARNSTYSNKDMARGAEDMAKRIARSIRSM